MCNGKICKSTHIWNKNIAVAWHLLKMAFLEAIIKKHHYTGGPKIV